MHYIITLGRPLTISYPCAVLNVGVNDVFSNPQYQDLQEDSQAVTDKDELQDQERKSASKEREYKKSNVCTIYFEVDGPYRAMVLPAAKEEGKDIKKR